MVERQPSKLRVAGSNPVSRSNPPLFESLAHVAQAVEHFLGKEEVTGSIPVVSLALSFEVCIRSVWRAIRCMAKEPASQVSSCVAAEKTESLPCGKSLR